MNISQYEKKAELLRALGHPCRICIVRGLLDGGCNVSKMQECIGIPQSTLSQHIAKLRAAGVIEGERRGNEICYRVVSRDAAEIIGVLTKNA